MVRMPTGNAIALVFLVVQFFSKTSKAHDKVSCADGSCGANFTLPDIESNGMIRFAFGEQNVGVSPNEKIMDLMRNINSYMTEQDQEKCTMKYDQCILWASTGECKNNPNFMKKECAPACFTCDIATMPFEQRCPMPAESEMRLQNAWEDGDLNRMFERIVQDEQIRDEYGLHVIRRPGMPNPTRDQQDSPWIITLDTFLSEDECKDLIQHGYRMGYEESTVLSAPDKSDISKGSRTSSNTWCREHCYEAATPILKRIERLTGIPMVNFEHLQLLKYQVGQFYKTHSDFIPHHLERAQGPRLLTVFLYLNDVTEGGGTNFPHLNVTVFPKQGRALVWPSVLDEDVTSKDYRTDHQALPVEAGIKFSANAWLHQRDFQQPFAQNCL